MKVREAQARYEKSVALNAKEDPKVFWRYMYMYVQSKTKVKDSIQCILDENDEVHSDNGTKAGLLNTASRASSRKNRTVKYYLLSTQEQI